MASMAWAIRGGLRKGLTCYAGLLSALPLLLFTSLDSHLSGSETAPHQIYLHQQHSKFPVPAPKQDFSNSQVSVDFLNTHPTPAKVAASSRAYRRPVFTLRQLMVPNPRQLFQIVSFFLKPQPHPTYPLSYSEDSPRSSILGNDWPSELSQQYSCSAHPDKATVSLFTTTEKSRGSYYKTEIPDLVVLA